MTRLMEQDENSQPSLAKMLGIAVLVVSIVGSVFGAGYNWRSISIVESSVADVAKNQKDYVRQDVQGQQLQNIDYRLMELSRQFEQMRAEMERERGRRQ